MAIRTRKIKSSVLPETFGDLVAELIPGVIHDDVACSNAMEMLARLSEGDGKLNPDQARYGELLGHLVATYKAAKHPRPKATGLKLLKGMMDNHDLKPADLARILGASRPQATRILAGERTLTWDYAQTLADYFGLQPEMFMERR